MFAYKASPVPPTDGSSWQLAQAFELNDGPSPCASVKTRLNTARPRLNRSNSAAVKPARGPSVWTSSPSASVARAAGGGRLGDDGGAVSLHATSASAKKLATVEMVARCMGGNLGEGSVDDLRRRHRAQRVTTSRA